MYTMLCAACSVPAAKHHGCVLVCFSQSLMGTQISVVGIVYIFCSTCDSRQAWENWGIQREGLWFLDAQLKKGKEKKTLKTDYSVTCAVFMASNWFTLDKSQNIFIHYSECYNILHT